MIIFDLLILIICYTVTVSFALRFSKKKHSKEEAVIIALTWPALLVAWLFRKVAGI